MHEALASAERWRAEGRRVVLATLVRVEGSAPRDPGAMLAVDDRGEIAGSVSSGCVESDVVERAERILATGRGELVTYGEAGPFSLDVGLTCGGSIDVVIAPLDARAAWPARALAAAAGDGERVTLETSLAGERLGETRVVDESEAPTRDTFRQTFVGRPEMIVFGAIDFSRAVATIGKFLGYRVTIVDARERFATAGRLPDADDVVVAWPDDYLRSRAIGCDTAIVVLTHDERFDVPLLAVALESQAGYVGVMGNRATHARRLAALRELGLPESLFARMHAPIGLDIGARTPEEVAISIAAELLATRGGRGGGSLRDTSRPMHANAAAGLARRA